MQCSVASKQSKQQHVSCDPARNQLFDLTNKLIQDKSHLLSLRSVGARGAGSTLGLWRAQAKSPTIKELSLLRLLLQFVGFAQRSTWWSSSRRVCQGLALPGVSSSVEVQGRARHKAAEEILTLVGVAAEVINMEEMRWTKFRALT